MFPQAGASGDNRSTPIIDPSTILLILQAAMLVMMAGILIGVIYLKVKTDPRPPKAGLMSDLYRR